jgi:hypothetical protein
VFAGHRIEALVGRGGMGVVYRATQITLELRFAPDDRSARDPAAQRT